MRRRLRKKKRLAEFIELGFLVRAKLVPALDDPGFDAFLDRWIDAFEGFVTRTGRASATDADRAAVMAFCEDDSAVISHDVGPLVDAGANEIP
jgi:uncharacterized protein YggL (DUF469 family)